MSWNLLSFPALSNRVELLPSKYLLSNSPSSLPSRASFAVLSGSGSLRNLSSPSIFTMSIALRMNSSRSSLSSLLVENVPYFPSANRYIYMELSAECVTLSSSPLRKPMLSVTLLLRDTLAASAPLATAKLMQYLAASISCFVIIVLLQLSGY